MTEYFGASFTGREFLDLVDNEIPAGLKEELRLQPISVSFIPYEMPQRYIGLFRQEGDRFILDGATVSRIGYIYDNTVIVLSKNRVTYMISFDDRRNVFIEISSINIRGIIVPIIPRNLDSIEFIKDGYNVLLNFKNPLGIDGGRRRRRRSRRRRSSRRR